MANYKSQAFIQFYVKRKNEQINQKIGGAYKAMATKVTIEKEISPNFKMPKRTTVLPTKLIESFQKVNSKYENELNSAKARQDEVTLSSSQAENLANEALDDYKTEKIQQITQKYDKKQQNLDQKSEKTQNSFNEKLDSLDEKYQTSQKNLNLEASEKGWKKSSIYDREMQKLETDYNTSKQLIESDFNQSADSLNFQKVLLEKEKQEALKNFDIAYAQKLSQKIDEITKQFNKQNQIEQTKVTQDLTKIDQLTKQEKAAEVLKYLKSYSKNEAKAFIRFHEKTLENELGSQVFSAVKGYIQNQ